MTLHSRFLCTGVALVALFLFCFVDGARAVTFACHFSCVRRVEALNIFCSSNGSFTVPEQDRIRELTTGTMEHYPDVPTLTQNPVVYLKSDYTESITLEPSVECGAPCYARCGQFCGGSLTNHSRLTIDQRVCLDATIPEEAGHPEVSCRSHFSPLPYGVVYAGQTFTPPALPRCDSSHVSPTPAPSASTCTEPASTQPPAAGTPRGTCSFSCIHPGEPRSIIIPRVTGTTSQRPGDAESHTVTSLGTGSTEEMSTCREATFEQRSGSACTLGSHCDCEQQCITACGSDSQGKTYCLLGASDARQTPVCDTTAARGHTPTCGNGSPTSPGSPTTLTNPLNTTSISELIARVIKAISGIAGAMALLMFVVGGIMWITAEGSDRVGTAQTILKNASIGLVLIFLSYSLVSLFLAVLGL